MRYFFLIVMTLIEASCLPSSKTNGQEANNIYVTCVDDEKNMLHDPLSYKVSSMPINLIAKKM